MNSRENKARRIQVICTIIVAIIAGAKIAANTTYHDKICNASFLHEHNNFIILLNSQCHNGNSPCKKIKIIPKALMVIAKGIQQITYYPTDEVGVMTEKPQKLTMNGVTIPIQTQRTLIGISITSEIPIHDLWSVIQMQCID